MNEKHVVIYMNKNYNQQLNLLHKLDEWNVDYQTKYINDHPEYLKELQNEGIYGTPVTYIDGSPIIGFREDKMKRILGI